LKEKWLYYGKSFSTQMITNRGMLKNAASGVPCLRRSGFAQAGRHFSVLMYSLLYAPPVQVAAALLDEPF